MQLLIDGDSDKCITRPEDSKTSTVTIRVEFIRQCLSSTSAQVLMQIVVLVSESSFEKVVFRKETAEVVRKG